MILPVTLTAAAAAAVITLWMALRIVPIRMKDNVLIGDAGNERLRARMRAQSNFAEYAPFVLILMGLIELAGGSSTWLWIASVVFVVVRILHVFGMDATKPGPLRMIGALGTWIVLALLAGWALAITYGGIGAAPVTVIPLDATVRRG